MDYKIFLKKSHILNKNHSILLKIRKKKKKRKKKRGS